MTMLEHRPAVYVLAGARPHYLYKGACRDLAERLDAHNAGRVRSTKGMRPLLLVYYEYCSDYSSALKRERFLKSGVGRKWLDGVVDAARVVEW